MIRVVFPGLLVVAALLAQACGKAETAEAPRPPTVSVLQIQPETIPITTEWTATLDGFVNAQIRPQVSGYLIAARYREGALVRKGDVLFEIDARPFEAALAQAQAQLALAQAELGRTERDVQRSTPLAKERAIPQSQLDNDVQANLAAQASVKAAQAAVETAQLNLGFTRVRSLIDGVAAIATAQIGDLVGPTTLLTTVSQVNPIRAYFSLSEREYLAIAAQVNKPSAPRGLWNTGRDLTLQLADGSEHRHKGAFLAADRQIDPRTGTIRISATFPNPDRILRPGQYGRVQATTQQMEQALLVPQRAVSELQGTAQVRIVDDQNRLRVVPVTLGSRAGNRWVVTTGLSPGARVVLDAPQIRPDTEVVTRPYRPEAESPAPAGSSSQPAAPRG
jgi:membrane fusion protein (multidrug efflux system)